MSKYIIGIDGGGTKTLGAVFNESGEIVNRVEYGFANFSANEEISKANIEKTLDKLVSDISPEEAHDILCRVPNGPDKYICTGWMA